MINFKRVGYSPGTPRNTVEKVCLKAVAKKTGGCCGEVIVRIIFT